MMLQYQSSLRSQPPAGGQYPALAALSDASPFPQYGSNAGDAMRALVSQATPALDMEAYKANTDYSLKQQDAQRQLALAGLKQQADAEQAERDIGTSRMQAMTGFANSLLSGLFN